VCILTGIQGASDGGAGRGTTKILLGAQRGCGREARLCFWSVPFGWLDRYRSALDTCDVPNPRIFFPFYLAKKTPLTKAIDGPFVGPLVPYQPCYTPRRTLFYGFHSYPILFRRSTLSTPPPLLLLLPLPLHSSPWPRGMSSSRGLGNFGSSIPYHRILGLERP
jgi:hypothetical protein